MKTNPEQPFFSTSRYDNIVSEYRRSFIKQDFEREELEAKWAYRMVFVVIAISVLGSAYIIWNRGGY